MIEYTYDILPYIWEITSITHSGRKGIRETPVSDKKYEFMQECKCTFSASTPLERGKACRILLKGHPYHDYWDLSLVIAVWVEKWTDGSYILAIETENSIYRFKLVKGIDE